MKQIIATELVNILSNSPAPTLVDVREQHELIHGMITGAIAIPMQEFGEQLHQLGEDHSQTIVLICRSGKRSEHVGEYLEQLGFTDVINLSGGMNGWATNVDTSMTVY
jgi:rhodanese-related sulfurtransferase